MTTDDTELQIARAPARAEFLETQRPDMARLLAGLLRPLDVFLDRIYTSKYNPLHQSGVTAVFLFSIVIVTGIYLFIIYKLSDPYSSVARLHAQGWAGRWILGLHRYSSDTAVAAVALHGLKMMAAGRTWGPRVLAWVTGLLLVGVTLVCGWTGLVMVWDTQGQIVAQEIARLLDVLPVFSEPLSRAFVGEATVPRSFFFFNLFLHVALPLGLALLLWIHVSRLARPTLIPPRRLAAAMFIALLALAVFAPPPLLPRADPLALQGHTRLDLFFNFWIPLSRSAGPGAVWALWGALALFGFTLPLWWRPDPKRVAGPSVNDESRCTGCEQCYLDCPFEAIQMVEREIPSKLSEKVARVNQELCVRCGICAGSCAPMAIGPPGRTGQERLARIREYIRTSPPGSREIVIFVCGFGIGLHPRLAELPDTRLLPVECAGSVHTSCIEALIRAGAGGVCMLSCPNRSSTFRHGQLWLEQRVYFEREAELKEMIDKRRVKLLTYSAGEIDRALRAIEAFRESLRDLPPFRSSQPAEATTACPPPDASDA